MTKKLALLIAACAMMGLSACNEDNLNADCVEQSKKCDQNSVYVCLDGFWKVGQKCDDKTACNPTNFTCEATTCIDKSKRCNANAVEICTNGAWKIETQCIGATLCNATSLTCEANTCSPNDSKRCNGNSIEVCTTGAWAVQTQCKATETCNATSLVCETAAACTNDNKRCNGNAVEICTAGIWGVETQCKATETCNATSLVCETATVTCDEATTRCSNGKLETCQNNAWTISDCDAGQLCPIGASTCENIACENGDTKCTTDGKLRSCFDQAWTISDCDTDQICPNGKTACEVKVCVEGQTVCNVTNKGVSTCINNALTESACVAPNEICNMGQCVACTNGDKRCQDNAVLLCAGNVWTTESQCGSKICDAATHTCLTLDCNEGWKRCNANTVEVCNGKGEYEAQGTIACAAGRYCLENATAHTTTCVACKENKDCIADNGATICHSNNTCVTCRAGIDLKCHASNGSLLTCNASGAWPSSGTACKTGTTCEAGKNECTPIPGYCSGKADCTDPLFTECQKNTCVCKTGQSTCIVRDGKAEFAICKASAWDIYNDCAPATPACNALKTQCVECSDDVHCAEDFKCDIASNTCKSSLVESTITWCNSQHLDATNRVSYGRIYDYRSTKDAATIKATLLCGKPGQAISDYIKIEGSYNASCSNCENNFEFQANLDALGVNTHLCVWSFKLPGEKAVACQKDGLVVKDFEAIPTEITALSYKFTWDQLIDFEAFKAVKSYTNLETVTVGELEMTKLGTIEKEGNGSIIGNTLVFADKYDHHMTVTNNASNTYIGILAFDYRGWLNDNFKDGQKIEVFLDAQDTPKYVLELSGKYESVQTVVITIDQNVKTFKIQRRIKGSDTLPRLLIDDVRWTNHK